MPHKDKKAKAKYALDYYHKRCAEDPEYKKRRVAQQRKAQIKRYGLSLEEYDNLYLAQEGKCKVCGVFMNPPHIDHNHFTGKVRGLLCELCNKGLGLFKDNIVSLRNAIRYLEEDES